MHLKAWHLIQQNTWLPRLPRIGTAVVFGDFSKWVFGQRDPSIEDGLQSWVECKYIHMYV